MRSSIFPVAVTVLAMINLANSAPGNEATSLARRGFASSCEDTSLKGWTLTALCKNSIGSYSESSLDLSQCLGWGAGGYLLCEPEEPDASQACTDLSINAYELYATCSDANGGTRKDNLNLDNCISNSNGIMGCVSHRYSHPVFVAKRNTGAFGSVKEA
ncbi:hypothetical protein PILCRDRAFT_3385 [Piloderma croceum F 1598]|uniref:Cyanovirin-N domain-containing protein n=1 Tax=Piloderma croceum (strain F 1598) TaxID=765440 RepID=A0A0C3G9G6_PILCF|nr:hypothetical protein PILCRDRAFT_3385 [Piloderma croceum F 1598]